MKKRDFKVRKCITFKPAMADKLEDTAHSLGLTQSQLIERALTIIFAYEEATVKPVVDDEAVEELVKVAHYDRDEG